MEVTVTGYVEYTSKHRVGGPQPCRADVGGGPPHHRPAQGKPTKTTRTTSMRCQPQMTLVPTQSR